ncbi:MAG: hypothetical protein GY781_17660, partial [Gammaproteobacteria bacterium]|nr:hypothetical protein [Gammaproteobacteria bacterium]
KMLVNAMHLAQCRRLSVDLKNSCLLMIDDLPSEIDSLKQELLLTELVKMPDVQLFISSINDIDLSQTILKQELLTSKMFHVEQGKVNCIKTHQGN